MSRPQSVMRAFPFWSISIFDLTDTEVSIMEKSPGPVETYALEIPVNHFPVMDVDQPLSNAYELEYFTTVNGVEMVEV